MALRTTWREIAIYTLEPPYGAFKNKLGKVNRELNFLQTHTNFNYQRRHIVALEYIILNSDFHSNFNFLYISGVCKKLDLTNQKYECSRGRSKDSMCEFSCPEGSRLVGSKIITCNSYGNSLQWSGNPPRCEPVCVKLTAGEFEMSCTNENFLNSRCTFRIGFFI